MTKIKEQLQTHGQTPILWFSLAVGLLAMFLFIGRPMGISWLVFLLSLLALLLVSGRRAGLQPTPRNLWLWPPLLFFATMIFLRANPFLTLLNVLATLMLLAFVFYFYAAGSAAILPLSGFLTLPLRMAASVLNHIPAVAAAGLEPVKASRGKSRKLSPLLRGALLSLPLLLIFTLLLSSADLVFASYLQRIYLPDFVRIQPYLGRGLFITLTGLLVGGAVATAVLRGLGDEKEDRSWLQDTLQEIPRRISLGAVETGTILLLVSGLFLFFVLLQFTYLFGGAANISREGFTYAEYARRGFAELVLTASLSLALIIFLNWITRRESKGQIKLFNTLGTLLIGLVLLILAAAFWRMRLYEQAYGYTELRLLVLVFESWLAVLLLWFLVTLWRGPHLFAPGFLVVGLCFAATLNIINPDRLIVHHNLERYRASGSLDVHYLTSLSADAVPSLVSAWYETRDDEQLLDIPYCYDADCAATMGELLSDNLHYRFDAMNEDQRWRSWPAYHIAGRRAYQELASFQSAEETAVNQAISGVH